MPTQLPEAQVHWHTSLWFWGESCLALLHKTNFIIRYNWYTNTYVSDEEISAMLDYSACFLPILQDLLALLFVVFACLGFWWWGWTHNQAGGICGCIFSPLRARPDNLIDAKYELLSWRFEVKEGSLQRWNSSSSTPVSVGAACSQCNLSIWLLRIASWRSRGAVEVWRRN